MYVIDSGGFSYYPDWSGLRYWNESLGVNESQLIADLVDHDGSGVIEIEEGQFGGYQNSLTSFPSAGIDADNNIYLSYSGVTEEHMNTAQMQHYRHVYMMKTTDSGATWTEPYDMINADFYEEPEFIPFIEAVYASIARWVDSEIHFTFQEDLSPGLVAWIDEDPAQISNIVYFSANAVDFSNTTVSNKEITTNAFGLSVQPNPATTSFTLSYELETTGDVQIRLLNSLGQLIHSIDYQQQAAGQYNLPISTTADMTSGLYLVQIQQADSSAALKVIIE